MNGIWGLARHQIPDCVRDCSSAVYNRGRVWIDHGSPAVADAFSRVSREDMDNFFKHRATEMASGGLLFVNSMIRADSELPALQFNDQYHLHQPYGEVFESTWEELVTEVCQFLSITFVCDDIDIIKETTGIHTSY